MSASERHSADAVRVLHEAWALLESYGEEFSRDESDMPARLQEAYDLLVPLSFSFDADGMEWNNDEVLEMRDRIEGVALIDGGEHG